ncbi:MAG: glycosyltransferase [Pseudomonadota bacterium]
MIFLTVGTQMPFDRLVRALDRWAARQLPETPQIVAQLGDIGAAGYRPDHMDWTSFMDPDVFRQNLERADLIVAHAGMGTIINALTYCKPIMIMPRSAAYGEHRNDHQIATVRQFRSRPNVVVADTEDDFDSAIAEVAGLRPEPLSAIASQAEPRLVNAIRERILAS